MKKFNKKEVGARLILIITASTFTDSNFTEINTEMARKSIEKFAIMITIFRVDIES